MDDTATDLDLLASILTQAGYELLISTHGPEALDLATRNLPDVILLDVLMPDMDGFEVCRQLKADPTTRDIPVLFITGQTQEEELIKGFKVGAVDYITKPFHVPELMARVKVHMDLLRARREIQILHGILPICAHCKKIRDSQGQWHPIEGYITRNSEAQFSHGLCPQCIPLFFPDYQSQ